MSARRLGWAWIALVAGCYDLRPETERRDAAADRADVLDASPDAAMSDVGMDASADAGNDVASDIAREDVVDAGGDADVGEAGGAMDADVVDADVVDADVVDADAADADAADADVVVADRPDNGCPPTAPLLCGGLCVASDTRNCGACGNICFASMICSNGRCGCPPSASTLCGGTTCVDAQNDRNNCGACGNRCPIERTCIRGVCETFLMRSCAVTGTPGCGQVNIAGGTFTMGGDLMATNAAMAIPNVRVSPFVIDQYEVTVARFQAYLAHPDRTAYQSGSLPYPGGPIALTGISAFDDTSCIHRSTVPGDQNKPANCINWSYAASFCAWDSSGGRLPTEAEWEFVARGRADAAAMLTTGRAYPWGDTAPMPACDRAHWNRCSGLELRPVGSFPATAGVYDLAGNVEEWVADRFLAYGTSPCWSTGNLVDPLCRAGSARNVVRGGSGVSRSTNDLRATSRAAFAGTAGGGTSTGFRCVRPMQ